MEEEVNYSTVVFKNGHLPPKDKNEDATVYAEVKHRTQDSAAAPSQAQAEAAAQPRPLLVCLGFLCVILIGTIVTIIYIGLNLRDFSDKNKQLSVEKSMLESQNEEISRRRDDLNQTLGIIMKFSNFPVDDFCPDKKCQPCRKGWILYQRKCYLFYDKNAPWKTWDESRQYCRREAADLVVIDHLQEQEFISNHTQYYYSEHHGFWIGLRQLGDQWVWVDGRNDTLGFWMKIKPEKSDQRALVKPGQDPRKSWSPEDNKFENKFICEDDKVLMWPK